VRTTGEHSCATQLILTIFQQHRDKLQSDFCHPRKHAWNGLSDMQQGSLKNAQMTQKPRPIEKGADNWDPQIRRNAKAVHDYVPGTKEGDLFNLFMFAVRKKGETT